MPYEEIMCSSQSSDGRLRENGLQQRSQELAEQPPAAKPGQAAVERGEPAVRPAQRPGVPETGDPRGLAAARSRTRTGIAHRFPRGRPARNARSALAAAPRFDPPP